MDVAKAYKPLAINATQVRTTSCSIGYFMSQLFYKNEALIPLSVNQGDTLFCTAKRLTIKNGNYFPVNGLMSFEDNYTTENIELSLVAGDALMFLRSATETIPVQLEYRKRENVFFGFYENMMIAFSILEYLPS